MDCKTLIQAIAKFLADIVLVGALLFAPAGTFAWPHGWRLIAILFVPMLIAGIVMMRRNPELLKKRLSAREEQKEQQARKELHCAGEHVGGDELPAVTTGVPAQHDVHGQEVHHEEEKHDEGQRGSGELRPYPLE